MKCAGIGRSASGNKTAPDFPSILMSFRMKGVQTSSLARLSEDQPLGRLKGTEAGVKIHGIG